MTTSTLEMTHDEWLRDRNKGLGGSDVATVLGLNKYKSLFQLWLEKTGQTKIDYTESEAAYWGNTLEEIVAKEFQERTGKKVIRRNQVFEHNEFPFLRANIDRWVTKENAILECKTANQYLGKEWDGDEIPTSYLCQVQHYMNVLNVKKAYIAVLIGGQKFVWKEINRDQELINLMQTRLVKFWETYILGNQEPPIDGEVSTAEYLKERYKNVNEREITIASSFDQLIEQKRELNQTKKNIEDSIRQIDNKIVKELGKKDASIGISPQNVICWNKVTTTRLNNELLKTKYPEIAKDPDIYKVSESRRLTIKEIK